MDMLIMIGVKLNGYAKVKIVGKCVLGNKHEIVMECVYLSEKCGT